MVVDESNSAYSPDGNTDLVLGRSHYVASHGQESAWGPEAGAEGSGHQVFSNIYDAVSPDAYRITQALYSSRLAKSARLEAVESTFNDVGEQPLEIIADAKAGDWQSAAADGRQMMEDQVEY